MREAISDVKTHSCWEGLARQYNLCRISETFPISCMMIQMRKSSNYGFKSWLSGLRMWRRQGFSSRNVALHRDSKSCECLVLICSNYMWGKGSVCRHLMSINLSDLIIIDDVATTRHQWVRLKQTRKSWIIEEAFRHVLLVEHEWSAGWGGLE